MKENMLFSPGRIGQLILKNRIVLPPMGTNMAAFNGEASERIIRFYAERARGGCGLIITEITRIDEGAGAGMLNQLSVTSPKYIPRLARLADAVHQYDSKIFLQLHHPGRAVSSAALGGLQPVAPSPIADGMVGEIPHELTVAECEELVGKFVRGAGYAKLAGFDGVELHAAHGYLIGQFLSPYSNRRSDRYGGDEAGRLQFLREIITGIQKTCGARFPISVRLSCDEYVEGGLRLEDSVRIAKELEKWGVAAINVSAGVYESGYAIIEPQGFPEGWKKHLAAEIRKNVSIPVIAVNNIKYPSTAQRYLEEGVCDFVAIGRGQLADPQWVEKARAGREDQIRKCLGCMYCFRSLGRQHCVECTVNPLVGREDRFNDDTLKVDGDGRSVAVIGGGPAGMQAALVLSRRGYRVTLFEKGDALGGTVRLAQIPPHKEMLAELVATMTGELASEGVTVCLNTPATAENVAALDPVGVFVAAGGTPVLPELPGIHDDRVCTAEDVLAGYNAPLGQRVAIIGGGVTGLETAQVLADKGHAVTVVEMGKQVGTSLYATVRLFLMADLKKAGVEIVTGQRLTEVKRGGVILSDTVTGERRELSADSIVLAMGVRPNRELAERLSELVPRIVLIGDADAPGQIADALKAANDRAWVF